MDNGTGGTNAKQQIAEAIKNNSTILVAVNDSPTVDELSAALGLTLILSKLEKRATSVFSGTIPPAITFLDPEKTFEGTVNSLRDFIIALDKEKADHLRYKVDGDVVKIFITPYHTTLTEADLQFSQGDYNVELVIGLGVQNQDHLDKALSAHGKILHDAAVTTITVGDTPSTLGNVDWRDPAASSLCEMLVSLSEALKNDKPLLDEQTATAFLTGIVAATDRFSNEHTSSRVMTMAAQLMAAGANQQLIAAKLQDAHEIGPTKSKPSGEKKITPDSEAEGMIDLSDNKSSQVPKKSKKAKNEQAAIVPAPVETVEQAETPEPVVDAPESTLPPVPQPEPAVDEAMNLASIPASEPVSPFSPLPEPVISPISADMQPEALAQASAEAELKEEAFKKAESVGDLDKQLSQQLADLTGPMASDAPNVQNELEAAANEPTSDTPVIEPTFSDNSMPGFEALDMPSPFAQAPTQPQPSDAIETHSGDSYVAPEAPAPFDAPVDSLAAPTPTAFESDKPVDPFSVPLPPLPEVGIGDSLSTPVAPLSDEQTPAPAQQQAPAAGAAPIFDMPPLPPLPDFSTLPTNAPASNGDLPSFPAPPPPPAFDQPPATSLPTQSGAISSDQLGDIFGDTGAAPATPAQPTAPSGPPPPGQFRIPGQ